MGIWSRLSTIVRGSVNDKVDKIESPRVLNQYIRDAQKDLEKFKEDIKRHTSNQFQLERSVEDETKKVEEYQRATERALQAGNEEQAREYMNQKVAREQKVTILNQELQQVKETTDNLMQDYKHLESRLIQLEQRKEMLLTQAHSAKARKKSHEIQQKVEKPNIGSDFDRIEKRIHQMQADADAEGYVSSGTSNRNRWDMSNSLVDEELDKLKAKMNSGKTEAAERA